MKRIVMSISLLLWISLVHGAETKKVSSQHKKWEVVMLRNVINAHDSKKHTTNVDFSQLFLNAIPPEADAVKASQLQNQFMYLASLQGQQADDAAKQCAFGLKQARIGKIFLEEFVACKMISETLKKYHDRVSNSASNSNSFVGNKTES